MARRKKKRKSSTAPALTEQIQRDLDRGQTKEAFKAARQCYSQDKTPEHRALLERAHLARVRHLIRLGMRDEARSSAEELVEFKPSTEEVTEQLPRVLVELGLYQAEAGEEADEDLRLAAADQAVLHLEEAKNAAPEVRQGAERIRQALAAVESSEDAKAAELLSDVPRSSPFADWKMFVRGLTAYYRHDTQTMKACWDRLDAVRAPARIADPLRAMARGQSDDDAGLRRRAALKSIEAATAGGPVVQRLLEVQHHFENENWSGAAATLVRSREVFRKFDPDIIDRVDKVLCTRLFEKADETGLSKLTRGAPGPDLDPHWNRAWAIYCEADYDKSYDDVIHYWERYLNDVASLSVLSDHEKKIARSLVLMRLGQWKFNQAVDFIRWCRDEGISPNDPEGAEAIALEHGAVDFYRQAVAVAPDLEKAHLKLTWALKVTRKRAEMIEAWREMLEHFPDNLDALNELGQHHYRRDEPSQALPYFQHIQRLKPLDKQANQHLAEVHVETARSYAMRKEWDKAREQFQSAERYAPGISSRFDVLCRRAILEKKAGRDDEAAPLIEQAQSALSEPTAALLVLSVESKRYGLPAKECREFHRQWTSALKRRCQSETAARMCQTIAEYFELASGYPGMRRDAEDVLAYVRRTRLVTWDEHELRQVCKLLERLPEEEEELHRLWTKGIKEFPDSPYFMINDVIRDTPSSPWDFDRDRAAEAVDRVMHILETVGDPDANYLRDQVKRVQRHIELHDRLPRRMFADDDDDDDDERDEYEGDEEFDESRAL